MKKRVRYYDDGLNNNKYILQKEIDGCGIYERMTPSGFYVHQDWGISFGDDKFLVIQSFMNHCKAEVLDLIDYYNETGKFDVKVYPQGNGIYVMHNSGNTTI